MSFREFVLSEHGSCESYCEHGGICTLDEGHEGMHNSGYCQWSKGISKEEADEILSKRLDEDGFP